MKKPILVSLAWLLAALAMPLSAGDGKLGGCTIACDQKLAQCERAHTRGAGCPRRHQECIDVCKKPEGEKQYSRAERRRLICQQNCEFSAQQCRMANPASGPGCNDGLGNCKKRCK